MATKISKKIIVSLLAGTMLTTGSITPAFAQSSANMVMVDPISEVEIKQLVGVRNNNKDFLEMVSDLIEIYPEKAGSIKNVAIDLRPDLVNEINSIIKSNSGLIRGVFDRYGQPNKDISIVTNKSKSSASPNPVGGAGMGIAAAGGGALLLAALAAAGAGGNDDGATGGGGGGTTPVNPSDPNYTAEFKSQYGLGMIGALEYYQNNDNKGDGVLVGIVDTGIDVGHEDLIDNIENGLSFSVVRGDADSGNISDKESHGTHVAGIIAGAKNDLGAHGVAYNARIFGVQAIATLDDQGTWFGEDIFPVSFTELGAAIDYATNAQNGEGGGTDIINHSWGIVEEIGGQINPILVDSRADVDAILDDPSDLITLVAAAMAASEADIIQVWATGNDGADQPGFLAGLPHWKEELLAAAPPDENLVFNDDVWVAVGSVDSNGEISSFSNKCGLAANWCLVAPGESIYSTLSTTSEVTEGNYGTMTGTSMAAPHVTGALALILSNNPEISKADAVQIIFDTATDLGEAGVDATYGHGLLNIGEAIMPQGNITLQTGGIYNANASSAYASGIRSNGVMGAAIMSAVSDRDIMVTDKYSRGFKTNMGSFVSEVDISSYEMGNKLRKFSSGQSSTLNMDDDGISLSFGDHVGEVSFGIKSDNVSTVLSVGDESYGVLSSVNTEGWVNSDVFSMAHLGVMESDVGSINKFTLGDGISLTTGLFTGSANKFVKDSSDNARAGTIGVNFDLSPGTNIGISVGSLSEKGTVLGSVTTGAFNMGNSSSNTSFMGLGGSFALDNSSAISFQASLGVTDFKQDGLITGGSNIKSRSLALGYSTKGVFNEKDSFTFGISKPLEVSSGSVNFDIPVARVASQGGATTSGVVRESFSADLSSNQNIADIQIGYSTKFNDNAAINLGAVYRANAISNDFNDKMTATVGFNWKF